MKEGGREIRQKDLREIEVEEWVEKFASLCSAQIVERNGGKITAVKRNDPEDTRKGISAIRKPRSGQQAEVNRQGLARDS